MNNTGLFPLSRALSLLLLAAAIITGDAQAAEQPPASFTDNVAVIRLLKRMDILPMVRSKLAHPPEADANLQAVMLYMSSRASDDELYRTIAPFYARHISINDANRLATGPQDSKGFATLSRQTQPEFDDGMIEVGRAYYMDRLMQGIKKIYLKMAQNKPGAPLQDLTQKATGLPQLDQPLALLAEIRTASARLDQALEADRATDDADGMLLPDRLVTAAGVASSKAELHRVEERLERYISGRSQLQADYRQRIAPMFSDRPLREGLDLGWSVLYKQELEYAETQREVIGTLRRLLDFMESRLGTTQVINQQLTFDDDGDVDLFNALIDKLETASRATPPAPGQP
jgi:hypothetical protein